MTLKISATLAIALCNLVVDAIDAGGGVGSVKVYNGTQPADPSVAITSQTLLATFALPATAFGNASAVSGGARATANAITDVNGAATANGQFFRVLDFAGAVIFDGTVTAVGGGGDMELNPIGVQSGVAVSIASWTYTQPKGF